MAAEFSFRTRAQALNRMGTEVFDLLVIGGGITGAAVARDAVSRGLKVALVERDDFASGTSSKSSKLIHGGLRYLENLEFALVFEALAERALLLKTVPSLVKPLPFFLPVYQGDPHGSGEISLGLWLYDLLALFRTPGFHKRLSAEKLLKEIPFLAQDGLRAGFRYFDASMWDDGLAIETVRAASLGGAAIANYVEAVKPLFQGEQIAGFEVRDLEKSGKTIQVKAVQTVVCAGPWTDELGGKLSSDWKPWLAPSKGVHLVFDLKRIPIPGAMVMSHPQDGRISFVIPRVDLGSGVVIVGTTDGPAPAHPEQVSVQKDEVDYLMALLSRYFPDLKLKVSDILSAYVGIRPLVGAIGSGSPGSEGQKALQKVSREHHIDLGPGGAVVVAGGKYTTHRLMAEEIVDFALKNRKQLAKKGELPALGKTIGASQTRNPVNPSSMIAPGASPSFSPKLAERYGAEAEKVQALAQDPNLGDPTGFPFLEGQLRWAIRNGMALHLEDFFFRRAPLFLSREDHGVQWIEALARVWAEERGEGAEQVREEINRLMSEIQRREEWRKSFVAGS